MKKYLWANDNLMVFTDKDIVQQRHNGGNPIFYCGQAEEFSRIYFSDANNGHKIDEAKVWLLGILYHERKDSLPDIKDITGYKSVGTLSEVIKLSGELRGVREATDLACQKKHGKSLQEYSRERMQKIWDNDDGSFRDKVSSTTSLGMQNVWRNDKNGSFRKRITKAASESRQRHLEAKA
jgi:hypothetical protein